ncbi:predicted protein [Ostreococcus lucimarinus CCE9901]|uniref:Uncharacterized protein n=1 Tax=Ostreococcus lucimarinus (strain CCE9901) TaxID=436017 RepID=A4RZE2_OSTLU|nr:predicted protein [Ostreococcus lucimarinus CCE9901]ABO96853.1 predicted protein [Ostreococcus lucimarinus CCE9901]|eukprot:XP_001418560.1 predicted protein [Ostreococcus lucimarinus CCE9901]
MSDIASPNSATKPSAARSNANGDDAATSAGAAQSGDAPWWRTIKVPRVSLHDVPVWGLKVSKTFNLRGHEKVDDKTSVTVGAMADYTSKQAHVFAKLEHELGEPGKIAVDVTGVELQKKFDVLEGIARTEVNVGVGVSWDGRPYINFDAMPQSAAMKGVGLAAAIQQGRSIDLRPTRPIADNLSIEAPFSLYRDGTELNLQVHGVIGALTLPKTDFFVVKEETALVRK